ncbi:hypothetical protein ACFQI3_09690 [Hansschlegelia quercus]|uniref:Uncharacterized protein n=1 Tax=Hansschlegelia quercus TaxID=2528245 RepID=A0A4Q9GLP8_9HYPH|nr:hypothetical protein [Hansschlegelia quercus]TBN54341.1 hypothetical protein EYR15_05770 [Hansschlegelia quercus]
MATFTRRALLGSAAVVAFGAVAYGGSRFGCAFVPRNHPDFFSLLDIAPDAPIARRIGERALELGSLPNDLPGFASALTERPLIRQALAEDCPTVRRTLVQDQCALDFAAQRTVIVDGWVLSETEASLCAARMLRPQQA